MHNIVPYSPLPGGGRGFFQVIWEGFQVVEVGKASKDINQLAKRLGFSQQLQGKLDHCLR